MALDNSIVVVRHYGAGTFFATAEYDDKSASWRIRVIGPAGYSRDYETKRDLWAQIANGLEGAIERYVSDPSNF